MIEPYEAQTQLSRDLLSCAALFRSGDDINALEVFLAVLGRLERLSEDGTLSADGLLPVLAALCCCTRSRDIVGMTDILEYALAPMVIKRREGSEEI